MVPDLNPSQAERKRALIAFVSHPDRPGMLETAGDSMHPLLTRGDRVGFVAARPSDLRVGDLFLFEDAGATVCHRFLGWVGKAGGRCALQKGDNISAPSEVEPEAILARVVFLDQRDRRVALDGGLACALQRIMGRYLGAVEVLWRIFGKGAQGRPVKRAVQRLCVRPLGGLTRRL